MSDTPVFVLEPGPHVHAAESTARILWWVNGSLAPAALWGVFVFGWPAAGVLLGAIAGALAAEAAAARALGRPVPLGDGSAFCTGLLLAFTLPPAIPWWMAFAGGAFAILLGKTIFGGLGFNLFNPALVGRAFLMACFPLAMTAGWIQPRPWFSAPLDAATTPTPLGALREHGVSMTRERAAHRGASARPDADDHSLRARVVRVGHGAQVRVEAPVPLPAAIGLGGQRDVDSWQSCEDEGQGGADPPSDRAV